MANTRYCTVDGCDKKYLARGLCRNHYGVARRNGSLVMSDHLSRTPEGRFWEKVDKSGDCWMWTGARGAHGYGDFHYGGGSRHVLAHRYVYELEVGPIPEGLELRHLCNNGHNGCVNPHHLLPGTRSDNMIDLSYAFTSRKQKLSVPQVLVARYAIAITPAVVKDMAAVFNVRCDTMQKAIVGKNFAHLPGAIKKRHTKKRQPKR